MPSWLKFSLIQVQKLFPMAVGKCALELQLCRGCCSCSSPWPHRVSVCVLLFPPAAGEALPGALCSGQL